MSNSFDQGYGLEPFRTLCSEYPANDVYPQSEFRAEWGPIFHRGRLDGSARILVIGQDPAQHETVIRRILVGEAGRRIQGFLAKVGIRKSYVMLNTFLYSVYGNVSANARRNPILVAYRNNWFNAILNVGNIEAVVSLGMHANEAWQMWKDTGDAKKTNVAYVSIIHPTQPESSSGQDKQKLINATKKMLQNWNIGLRALAPAIKHPDKSIPLVLYGDKFADDDKPQIPEFDLPPGLPSWMRENDGWAKRVGNTPIKKRANITLIVPKDFIGQQE